MSLFLQNIRFTTDKQPGQIEGAKCTFLDLDKRRFNDDCWGVKVDLQPKRVLMELTFNSKQEKIGVN